MPSGNTHDRITLWTLPWIGGITALITHSSKLTLIVAGTYLFSGLMFGPDLDIHSIQYKRWGLLGFIWLPYRKMMAHRSIFSHGIIIGTVVRILYLLSFITIFAILIIGCAQLIWGFHWNWQTFVSKVINQLTINYPQETIAALIGLELGSNSHSFSDWIVSGYKRKQRNKRKKTKKKN